MLTRSLTLVIAFGWDIFGLRCFPHLFIKTFITSLIRLLYFKSCAFLPEVFMKNDDKPLKVVEF